MGRNLIIKKVDELLDEISNLLYDGFIKKGYTEKEVDMERLAQVVGTYIILPKVYKAAMNEATKNNTDEITMIKIMEDAVKMYVDSVLGLTRYEWWNDEEACRELIERISRKGLKAECVKKGLIFKKVKMVIRR